MFGSLDSFVMTAPAERPLFCQAFQLCTGDVTRDDAQRRFLAQHSVVMLEQCWNNVVTIRNDVATMLQRRVALKIVVANRLV